MRKPLCLFLALCACVSLCACSAYTLPSGTLVAQESVALPTLPNVPLSPTPAPAEPEPTSTPACQLEGERNISAWAVYWDTQDVLAEIAPYADRLGTLCYFEAYFASSDGSFVMPDTLSALYSAVEKTYPDNKWDSYLTFVNDVQDEDGVFDLKTAEFIAPFLADENAMDAHIDDLIAFTRENGFDGVEIDYEALRKLPELWAPFTQFCGKLYARTQEESLKLRIVLEPYAPFDEYDFPEGPTYVIMCYNLFGGHSAPGPKADYEFLDMLLDSASTLPGKRIYALATGGYDWDAQDESEQVSARKAYELFTQQGFGEAVRDEKSGALAFQYADETYHTHTVWYADEETLGLWSKHLTDAGFGEIAYWRLGGNYLK